MLQWKRCRPDYSRRNGLGDEPVDAKCALAVGDETEATKPLFGQVDGAVVCANRCPSRRGSKVEPRGGRLPGHGKTESDLTHRLGRQRRLKPSRNRSCMNSEWTVPLLREFERGNPTHEVWAGHLERSPVYANGLSVIATVLLGADAVSKHGHFSPIAHIAVLVITAQAQPRAITAEPAELSAHFSPLVLEAIRAADSRSDAMADVLSQPETNCRAFHAIEVKEVGDVGRGKYQ